MAEPRGALELLTLLNPNSSADIMKVPGGKAVVTREDVLSALAGISDFHEFFVFASLGMLDTKRVMGVFADEAYRMGFDIQNNFRLLPFESEAGKRNVFPPLWYTAWRGYYCSSGEKMGDRWLARKLGVGQGKAKALRPVFSDAMTLLYDAELEVSTVIKQHLKN